MLSLVYNHLKVSIVELFLPLNEPKTTTLTAVNAVNGVVHLYCD